MSSSFPFQVGMAGSKPPALSIAMYTGQNQTKIFYTENQAFFYFTFLQGISVSSRWLNDPDVLKMLDKHQWAPLCLFNCPHLFPSPSFAPQGGWSMSITPQVLGSQLLNFTAQTISIKPRQESLCSDWNTLTCDMGTSIWHHCSHSRNRGHCR